MSVSGPGQKVPRSAQAARMIESSRRGSAKTHYSTPKVFEWLCENCGDSGMTTYLNQCPQCQHCRCTNCKTQRIFSNCEDPLPVTNRHGVPKKTKTVLSLQYGPKPLLIPSGPAISAISEQDVDVLRNPAAESRNTPLPSIELPDLVIAKDTGSSSYNSTPSSEVILTPTSTQESDFLRGLLSHQDYMDSETEIETDDTESTEDMSGGEDAIETFAYTIDYLDSRLFSILGHNPQLASRLIPQIHAQMQLGFRTEAEGYTDSPSDGSDVVPETEGRSSVSSSIPGKENYSKESPPRKRGRERDGSKDRGDKSGAKRQRRTRNRSAVPRHRFACHFNKKDPERYCPLNDPKFNVCLGRGNPQLRRMKEHYEKAHRPSQCDRCYAIFKDRDELKGHLQTDLGCEKRSDILKEGIDDSQWAKIEPLFHVRRKLSPSQKEQDDFDKWFEIWDILFPNISRPSTPWVDIVAISSHTLPNDAESLLAAFNTVMELDFASGVLQRDDLVHQRYERGFRAALQLRAEGFLPAVSLDNSFLEVISPRNNLTENQSWRQNTVDVLENSFGPLISLEPAANQLLNPYQGRIFTCFETQSVRSSSRQLDVPYSNQLQRPNESGAIFHNVQNVPNAPGSVIDLTGESTTQNMAGFAIALNQLESISFDQNPVGCPTASSTEPGQDCSELFRDSEFVGDSYYDPWQDDFMPFNHGDFDFNEHQLSSDLTMILESENDDPAAMTIWQNRHTRNHG